MLISVSTNKGGAGKTIIATNLAAAIAQLFPDKKILLVDLDGQCDVSVTFGKSANNYVDKSILSIIQNKKQISEVIDNNITNHNNEIINNLFIIYSEPNMRGFDHVINDNYNIQDNLLKILGHLKEKFDYIIVDTPPSFSSINVCSFLISDIVITPFEADRYNIEGALNVVKELKKDRYVNKPHIYLLPNKVKDWISLDNELIKYIQLKIKNESNVALSKYFIPDSNKFKYAVAKERRPLMLSSYKLSGALTQKSIMVEITKDILGMNKLSHLNKKEEHKLSNLDKILNKNYDNWLKKINERYQLHKEIK